MSATSGSTWRRLGPGLAFLPSLASCGSAELPRSSSVERTKKMEPYMNDSSQKRGRESELPSVRSVRLLFSVAEKEPTQRSIREPPRQHPFSFPNSVWERHLG